jgi:aryl-alcohol dehydrogenase-like predicted oxidoreductase
VSNVGAEVLAAAREVAEIVCVQNRHAPGYERSDADEVLTACREARIAFVPFFSIAGQSREGSAEERYDAVEAIAVAHGATPAQVRIAWTLALGENVLAIPGTGDLTHLEQNVEAASLRLTDDELERLGALPAT